MVPYFKDQGPKTHFYNPNIKPCLKESRSVKKSKSKLKLTLAKLILEQLSPSLWIRNNLRLWNGRVN